MMKFIMLGVLTTFVPLVRGESIRVMVLDREHSKVEVAVKATVDSFQGQVENYQAQIAIDPQDMGKTQATFSFLMLDLKTGKSARDEEMHKWQETLRYPRVDFQLDRLELGGVRSMARGKLNLHGVTREVTFPVNIASDRGVYAVDGEVMVDTLDFQLPLIRKFMVLKVDPKVMVRFHLQGSLAQ